MSISTLSDLRSERPVIALPEERGFGHPPTLASMFLSESPEMGSGPADPP